MSELNFICKKCKKEFDCDVGEITFPPPIQGMRPTFEKDIRCNRCGVLTMDQVELTELGQTQITELHFRDMRNKCYKKEH